MTVHHEGAPATSIAPWLAVSDAQAALAFYRGAFGASELHRLEGDGGTLEVAQLAVDGAEFWVQHDGAATLEGLSTQRVRMILSVANPDVVFAQALAAGATEVRPVSEAHGWRSGRLTDPFGYDWEIARQLNQ